jgi:hypothetical protein
MQGAGVAAVVAVAVAADRAAADIGPFSRPLLRRDGQELSAQLDSCPAGRRRQERWDGGMLWDAGIGLVTMTTILAGLRGCWIFWLCGAVQLRAQWWLWDSL